MVSIVTHKDGEPMFGDTPLLSFAQTHSFPAMVLTMLSGKIPKDAEEILFNLLLTLSIDHGADAPSAVATIARAKEGASMGEAVGSGIQAINEQHGGAVEGAMRLFYEIADGAADAEDAVATFLQNKKRIPGFGHRIYKKDPRAELLMAEIEHLGFAKNYLVIAREVESAIAKHLPEKILPLNIDGAMAAALCTLGWKPEWSTAVFIVSRSAGLTAHYLLHR